MVHEDRNIMKVLFIRLRKNTDFNPVPHLGLGLLASVLKAQGHDVKVLDYLLFLTSAEVPSIEDAINDFKPDIVGFSIYTATHLSSLKAIERIARYRLPIIVGGPHPTLYPEDMKSVPGISYIVLGEAEDVIAGIVHNASYRERPEVIDGTKADMKKIAIPDFKSFYNWETISQYPLQTSRGCPFNCSFCSVKYISSRLWRSRDVMLCVDELELAKKEYPHLEYVKIVDDAPTIDIVRFKNFLKEYISRGINLKMTIDNVRADTIDEEFVALAKAAGNGSLCVGVESGNEEVFKEVNKGETLDEVRRAARLIKMGGLSLGLCFVIGLPYDNLKRVHDSINLSKELQADFIFWNMVHPMERTGVMEWFKKNNARIYDTRNYSSYDAPSLRVQEPVVETRDFPRYSRKRAYFMAVVDTEQYPMTPRELFFLFSGAFKYRYIWGVTKAFSKKVYRKIKKVYKKSEKTVRL